MHLFLAMVPASSLSNIRWHLDILDVSSRLPPLGERSFDLEKTSLRPAGSSAGATLKPTTIISGIMRRSCHFKCLGTLERQRGRPADPKKCSLGCPTRSDADKTVVKLMEKPLVSFLRAYLTPCPAVNYNLAWELFAITCSDSGRCWRRLYIYPQNGMMCFAADS